MKQFYYLILSLFLFVGAYAKGSSVYDDRKNKNTEISGNESLLQQITITGIVTDTNGSPMPGVNVIIEGTSVGVVTDVSGKFSINVPNAQAVLQFSFVGYLTEKVAVAGKKTIEVTLIEDMHQLQEVVVTALGIKREKKALGYAVTEVKGDEVAISSTISPVNALQGKVAGLSISPTEGGIFGGSKIQIRGNSTLRDNNMPIFVVDGIIIDNELSGGNEWGGSDWGNNLKNLNADEFETVSVLKGAAATALYGSRAMNGAIVITTKKGKSRKDLGVKFSERYSFKKAYAGPAFQNIYGEGAMPGYDSSLPDMYNPSKTFPVNGAGEPIINGEWAPMSYGHKMDGSKIRDYEGNWITYDPQPDNFLQAYQTGFQNNANLSLEGGSDNTTFLVSFSNMKEQGIIPRNTFDRNSVFAKINRKFNDFISSEIGISYSNAQPKNPLTDLGSNFINNWPRNYNTNYWKNHYKASHGGIPSTTYNDPGASMPAAGVWFNLYENNEVRKEEMLRMTGKVTLNFTNWFNMAFDGYVNNYYTSGEKKELGQGYRNAGGSYTLDHSIKEQYDGKLWLNFNKKFGEDFDARASLVVEHWQTSISSTKVFTKDGLIVPGNYSISNSVSEPGQEAKLGERKTIQSVYAFADVSWKNQVFLSLTGRNDWSSALVYGDGHGNFSYFYPSVSLSWLFTETVQLPEWFSYGKLRGSWAHVGNDIDAYTVNSAFKRNMTVQSYNGDLPAYTFNSDVMPNLNVKPEDQKSIEFGFDSKFFQNRFGIGFTYYKTNTYNQILNIPAPTESGVNSQLINAGDIQNQGVEIELTSTPVKIKSFEWFVNATFARNRGKINSLAPGVTEYLLDGSWNYGNTRIGSMAIVGGDYGILVSDSDPNRYKNANDPNDPLNGKPLLTWNTGQRGAYMTRSYEKRQVGNINPKFTGSFSTGFSFKNFRIEGLFDFKIGGQISTYTGRYGTAYGLLESTLANRDKEHGGFEWTSKWTGNTYDDGYIPDGVFAAGTKVQMKDINGNTITNDVGGLTFQQAYDQGLVEPEHGAYWHWKNNSWGGGVINDAVLQENSYIGFRQLTVTYRIPSFICNKVRVSSADISFVGRDLGYIYKTLKDNLNPFSLRSNRAGDAFEWQQTPYTRTLGFSLNVNF